MSIFSCHNKTSYCSFFNSTIEGHFSLSTFYELVQRIMEVIELSNKAFMGYNFQWKYWWQTDWRVCFWCSDSLYKRPNSKQKIKLRIWKLSSAFGCFRGYFSIIFGVDSEYYALAVFWLMKSCKGFLKIFLKNFLNFRK